MRLHLVDGTYELFRAHFSRRPPHDVGGRDLKATAGLVSSMLALLTTRARASRTSRSRSTTRSARFETTGSTATRPTRASPPELLDQFDVAEDAARAVGMVVWRMDRYEADDALATGAARWRDRVEQVRDPHARQGPRPVDRRAARRGGRPPARSRHRRGRAAAIPRHPARERPGLARARRRLRRTAIPGSPGSARRPPLRCSARSGTSRTSRSIRRSGRRRSARRRGSRPRSRAR